MSESTVRKLTKTDIDCSGAFATDPKCPNKATVCETVSWDLGRQGKGTSFFYMCDDCFKRNQENRQR